MPLPNMCFEITVIVISLTHLKSFLTCYQEILFMFIAVQFLYCILWLLRSWTFICK